MPLPFAPEHALLAAAAGLLVLAAVCDWRDYMIPNLVPGGLAALYPFYVLAAERGVDWQGGALCGAGVLAVGFGLFAMRAFGGGDAKMMAAVALWAGPKLLLPYLLFTAVAGGGLTLLLIAGWRVVSFYPAAAYAMPGRRLSGKGPAIPYGVAIAIGGMAALATLARP